ncbi:MAG TPA: phosphatidylglycerophosphatase A [Polyangiaceae bacterium]|jgi:phosphatidylglycerophosphatase A
MSEVQAESRPQASLTVRALATWFGCGRSKLAPGTMGSFGAVPLHLGLRLLPLPLHIAAIAGVTAIGVWSANEMAKAMGVEDPQCVVIDEVAGTLIAMGMVKNSSISVQLLALGLFRLFDVWKPGVIDTVQNAKPEGVGIMADDVLAGLLAGAVSFVVAKRI